MQILKLNVGDCLIMKKNHPCGANEMRVLRLGSDIKIECVNCQRQLTLPREKLERSVKGIKEN